ncbi:adenosylcobinamide-phosphate synthase CbiB [Marinobacter nauticus]
MENWAVPVIVSIAAVLLDHLVGEPRRWHPLVGFGNLVVWVERLLNSHPEPPARSLWVGGLGVLILCVPFVGLALAAEVWLDGWTLLVTQVVVLALAVSLRGLAEHGRAVGEPLARGDMDEARRRVGYIVSRDAAALDEQGVAAAASESMLENGADAVFASLFWFLVAGLPGVVLHRLVNTLDAMWGYRNARFEYFGRCAARLDDLMNWIPARLTALTYALLGNTQLALRCWRRQAPSWDSPNAGPVMAAGAGALEVTLGGPAPYWSGVKQRPVLGAGGKPGAGTVEQAIRLVQRGVALWFITLILAGLLGWLLF